MATLTTQDEYIRTALRLPRDLHAKVQADAESLGRSMNAQIIAILEGGGSADGEKVTHALKTIDKAREIDRRLMQGRIKEMTLHVDLLSFVIKLFRLRIELLARDAKANTRKPPISEELAHADSALSKANDFLDDLRIQEAFASEIKKP